MAEAEVKTFWQRQRLAEAEVENPHDITPTINGMNYHHLDNLERPFTCETLQILLWMKILRYLTC